MALLYMNSMRGYSDTDDLERGIENLGGTGNSNFVSPPTLSTNSFAPLTSMKGYDPSGTAQGLWIAVPDISSFVTGLLVYPTVQVSSTIIFTCYEEAVDEQLTLNYINGEISIDRGSTEIARTDGLGMWPDRWYFIEFKATISNTGSYELRINGENVLSGSADTQQQATASVLSIRWLFGSTWLGVAANMYILDLTGLTLNDFTDGVLIEGAAPDSDGTRNDFTRSAGLTNYETVDDGDTASGSLTDYVEGSVIGNDELYGFPALAIGTPDNVHAAGTKMLCQKMEAGFRSIGMLIRSNVTEVELATRLPSISDGYFANWSETNPDGGGAWSQASVEAAEFGYTIKG